MTTATATAVNEWVEFHDQMLLTGDRVQFRGEMFNKEGIVVRKLRKNYLVLIKDVEWSASPTMIFKFKRGNPDDALNVATDVSKSAGEFQKQVWEGKIKTGDVILCHRGGQRWDVMRVTELPNSQRASIRVDRVPDGKRFRVDPNTFVQRLSDECFSK